MKVLLLNLGYPPAGRGGAEIHAHMLAQGLSARGHRVSVFHRYGDPYRADYYTAQTTVEGIPVTRINNLFRDATSMAWIFENPYMDEALVEVLDADPPDVVHVYHLSGLSTTILERIKERNIPLVMTVLDFWMVCPRGQRITPELEICYDLDRRRCVPCLQKLWPNFAEDITLETLARLDQDLLVRLRACDLLIAPTAFHRARMLEIDLAPDKVKVIPLGIDHGRISLRAESRFPPKKIGYIGSVIPTKGVHVLIEAFSRLGRPDMECHIHGPVLLFHEDDGYLNRLHDLARDDLTYFFHGPYDQADLKDILARLDVIVVPSIWWESYCITLREAMLAGVPVLASDLGAMREALEPTGLDLLFRPGDAEDLARKLRSLIEDEALYRQASQLRSRVDGLDDMIDEIEADYHVLVGAPAPRRHQGLRERAATQAGPTPYVTVVIPTWNGGGLFKQVLGKVLAQETPFDFEVLCIDSGSQDGTVDVIKAYPSVRLLEIPQETFNHGLTRNLGVREAYGEVVVLLTQDAEPYDVHWLETLVGNLNDPSVAGAYCHQRPRDDCNPFQRERLQGWTHGNGQPERKRLRHPGQWNAMDPIDRLKLIAFDNVASCVRKSVMDDIPFEKRQFGEDLTWSRKVLQAGYTTVMDPCSVVIHSHNRSIWYEFKRVYLDHQNLHALVGLQTIPTFRLVLSHSWRYLHHLLVVVKRDDRGALYRLWWMMKAPAYAFTQNLAQYLGAQSDIRGEQGRQGMLHRWVQRGV